MVIDPAVLMARYCDGDISALGELYTITAPQLLNYLRVLLRDRALAEDVLQDTYLKISAARNTYIRGADPMPWLYTIARRTALDEMRRIRRRGQSRTDVDDLAQTTLLAACEEQNGAPELHERRLDALLAGLDALPESQRAVIVLTRLKGKNMAEAARLFGTNTGAMRARAHRGYRALRKLLRMLGHLAAAVFISSGSKSGLSGRPAAGPSGRDEGPGCEAARTIHTDGA